MALTYDAARLLSVMRSCNIRTSKICTLGRQDLLIDDRRKKELDREFCVGAAMQNGQRYADGMLRSICDAQVVDAIDASDYEGARHIVDMNRPVDSCMAESYDLVFDGGTLEHIFHFTTALENSIRLIRPGGWFVSHTIANGFSGHGFYQFSPELFFRALSAESGFCKPIVIAQAFPSSNLAVAKGGDWHLVTDPNELNRRVLYSHRRPLSLMIAARKIQHMDAPFAVVPQQSDYQQLWHTREDNSTRLARRRRYDAISKLPWAGRPLSAALRRYHGFRFRSLRNREFFRVVTVDDMRAEFRERQIVSVRSIAA